MKFWKRILAALVMAVCFALTFSLEVQGILGITTGFIAACFALWLFMDFVESFS